MESEMDDFAGVPSFSEASNYCTAVLNEVSATQKLYLTLSFCAIFWKIQRFLILNLEPSFSLGYSILFGEDIISISQPTLKANYQLVQLYLLGKEND